MTPITLILRKEPPHWISVSVQRVIMDLLEGALTASAVEGPVTVSFSHEQSVLKRRPPALSLSYQSSSRFNTPQTVAVNAAGKDARNDQCGIILGMPAREVTKFRAFMTSNPLYEKNQSPPAPEAEAELAPAPPEFDSDSIALFLDSLRDAGGNVTRSTANIVAARLFNGQTAILDEVIHQEFVTVVGEICQISTKGMNLLGATMEPPSQLTTMDHFEALRRAVKERRQRLEALNAEHSKTASTRTKLTLELEESNKLMKTAAKSVENCRERLSQAENHHRQCRAEVLKVEDQLRHLPADADALAVAKLELEAAEDAYKKFVEI